MQQHNSKYLHADPPHALLLHDPRVRGQKIKISVLSEYGQVAYQIKGNHECSNMVQIVCSQTPPYPRRT